MDSRLAFILPALLGVYVLAHASVARADVDPGCSGGDGGICYEEVCKLSTVTAQGGECSTCAGDECQELMAMEYEHVCTEVWGNQDPPREIWCDPDTPYVVPDPDSACGGDEDDGCKVAPAAPRGVGSLLVSVFILAGALMGHARRRSTSGAR